MAPPSVSGDVPLSVPVGGHSLVFEATDDRKVTSATLWYDGDKIAFLDGNRRRLPIQGEIDVKEGTRSVVVEAEDDQGTTARRTWWIRGLDADGAAAERAYEEAESP